MGCCNIVANNPQIAAHPALLARSGRHLVLERKGDSVQLSSPSRLGRFREHLCILYQLVSQPQKRPCLPCKQRSVPVVACVCSVSLCICRLCLLCSQPPAWPGHDKLSVCCSVDLSPLAEIVLLHDRPTPPVFPGKNRLAGNQLPCVCLRAGKWT